jgi:thioredoxin-related protein
MVAVTLTRRDLMLGTAAALALPARSRAAPQLTDEGLYREPWFLDSFMVLPEDLAEADKQGKRFVVMWELKGCPYCKETHFTNFARPDIADYIKANFVVQQLNIIGLKTVTDFDGEELTEKAMAKKYNVQFTPTFQFFGEDPARLKPLAPQAREVARAPGYFRPDDFLAMFRFVREKAYETKSLRDYLKSRAS